MSINTGDRFRLAVMKGPSAVNVQESDSKRSDNKQICIIIKVLIKKKDVLKWHRRRWVGVSFFLVSSSSTRSFDRNLYLQKPKYGCGELVYRFLPASVGPNPILEIKKLNNGSDVSPAAPDRAASPHQPASPDRAPQRSSTTQLLSSRVPDPKCGLQESWATFR